MGLITEKIKDLTLAEPGVLVHDAAWARNEASM